MSVFRTKLVHGGQSSRFGPTIAQRQREPFPMLASPFSFEAGTRLRAKRERLHLSIRRVAQMSKKIAQEKNDPAFFVPHNWISDLENGKSKPRLLPRFHSLSLIYDCDINEILAAFGLNIADLGNERGHISLPHTHLSGLPLAQSDPRVIAAPQLPLKLPLQQTNLVHRMFQGLGEMPFFLLQQAGPQEVLYGYVGTDDYTLDPIIRPGAFVQIDPEQNRVIRGIWPSEHERPVYFVELRDNHYAVCWCELEGHYLLLVPSPKSPVPIRHLRYPQDADIVGRVVGFAHLIAPLHSKTVAAPSPGTGML
jgi:transcriptional regulator with XRE-family HTH domain